MPNVFLDKNDPEPLRRLAIFEGALYLDSPSPAFTALTDFARGLTEQYFHPAQAQYAQHELPLSRFIEIASALKSEFTNHEYTQHLLQAVLLDRDCDLDTTYFDVPRLRIVTSGEYLRSGVGYAYLAHRDTWYAAPQCQINWWSPLYDLEPTEGLVFYTRYFDRICQNCSRDFDYTDWKENGRPGAILQTSKDMRKHPLPQEDVSGSDQLSLLTDADYCLQFSAAHLHATDKNTSGKTRFSIDFRSFNLTDLEEGKGAKNLDNHATGTTLIDFIRASDFSPYSAQYAKVT